MTSVKATTPVEWDEPKPSSRRHRHRHPLWWRALRKLIRRVNWRLLLSVTLTLVFVAAIAGVALVTDASSRVQGSVASLSRVLNALSKKSGAELTLDDFNRVKAAIDDLRTSMAQAQRQTGFLRPFADWNADLAAQFDVLDAGYDLTVAARTMSAGIEPTLFFMLGGTDARLASAQISSGARVAELLQLGQGQYLSANDQLTRALELIERLPLTRLSPELLLNVETLRTVQARMQQLNNLLIDSPEMLTEGLGFTREQNYLILSQNSDELRPSGGYISTYGWLSVRNGRITAYDYGATTGISPNPPSASAANPYPVPVWWIPYAEPVFASWDGSWTPDFATTAQMAKWYYDNGNNPHSPVDGVIGIDLIGFQYLLNALGEVPVPEYSTTVTPANFRTLVYDLRGHAEEGDAPHKRFLASFYRQVLVKMQSIDDRKTNNLLLGALLQGLLEKHVMLYLPDTQIENALETLGWSGMQDVSAGHDYLMAVDANLGNKSNSSVVRQLTYDVEIKDDGALASTATVSYDYPASLADHDPAVNPPRNGPRDYANLLQLYTPAGSGLTQTQGIDGVVKAIASDVHNTFVTRFVLHYNGAETLQFAYTLPKLIEPFGGYERYRLLVQKQPGSRADALSVQVRLPKAATLVLANPAPVASYQLDQQVVEFQMNLTTDQWIEVIFKRNP